MKQVFYCTLFICLSIAVSAQSSSNQKRFSFPKQATINLENIAQDFSPALLVKEMPKPGSQKMVHYNYPANSDAKRSSQNAATLPNLALGVNYFGQGAWLIANDFNGEPVNVLVL